MYVKNICVCVCERACFFIGIYAYYVHLNYKCFFFKELYIFGDLDYFDLSDSMVS